MYVKCSILNDIPALNTSSQSCHGASLATGNHTVLPATARQAGTRLLD